MYILSAIVKAPAVNNTGEGLVLEPGDSCFIKDADAAYYQRQPGVYTVTAVSPTGLATVGGGTVLVDPATGLVSSISPTKTAGRPTLLMFGCSISGQSCRSVPGGITTTVTAEHKAGSTVLTVNDASTISVGNKVALLLGFQGFHKTTVTAVDTAATPDTITIADPLPFMMRTSAGVVKYTTPDVSSVRLGSGAVMVANALKGGVFDVLPGYGYGGAMTRQMVADLPRWLRFYNPTAVFFNLLENDIAGSTPLADLQRMIKFAAKACVGAGAIPIFGSCMPSSSIASGRADEFDAMLAYVMNIGNVVQGAIGIDLSTPWLDTAQPTIRTPLAGWTDGVHPVPAKQVTIAGYINAVLDAKFGNLASLEDYSLDYYDMSGTGGTATGLQGGSAVPAGWTLEAQAGVTCTSSKTADDTLRAIFSVAGASNVSSTQVLLTRSSIGLSTSMNGQYVKGYAKIKVNALTNITLMYPGISFNTGESHSCWQDTDFPTNPDLIGKTLTIETAAVRVPYGAINYGLSFSVRPATLGSPSGVAGDVEIIEFGLLLAAAGEPSTALYE